MVRQLGTLMNGASMNVIESTAVITPVAPLTGTNTFFRVKSIPNP
jgi:hypothetical protein